MNPRTRRRLILSGSITAATLTLAVSAWLGRGWYRDYQVAEGRRLGMEFCAAGDFRNALPQLSIAARNAKDAEVVLALAESRMSVSQSGLRHFKNAAGLFRNVLLLDPSSVRAKQGELECAIGLSRFNEIPEIAGRVLELDPTNVRALEATLQVRAAQGRWADALTLAQRLSAIEPNEIRWRATQLHCLAASGGDNDGRLELARQWLKESPESVGLAILVADTLRGLGQLDEARDIFSALSVRGSNDARLLSALLEGLEATGLSDQIEAAIAASTAALADPVVLTEIEGERLLRAGRLDELRALLDKVAPTTSALKPSLFRLRFAAEFLAGNKSAAKDLVTAAMRTDPVAAGSEVVDAETDPFQAIAQIAFTDSTRRDRINQIEERLAEVDGDPVVAIMLSELYAELGEFDAALTQVSRAFDVSLHRSQPAGLRAVHLSVILGRIPDALSIARDLGLRYQRDGAVATAILKAWASALEVGYVPSRVYGALGSDSPESLAAYWESLNRPAELAPLVAEVFARRGQPERAQLIIEELLKGERTSDQLLQLLPTSERINVEFGKTVLEAIAPRPLSAFAAVEVAKNFQRLGRTSEAIEVLDRNVVQASDIDKRRLARFKRILTAEIDASISASSPITAEWLRAELISDRGIETASFVLARPEVWVTDPSVVAANAELVTLAIDTLRDAVGRESQRVIVAEATMNLVFYATDAARMAGSLSALAAAERASPTSVGVLTTFARYLEIGSPPDLVRAADLLSRAVQLQPGSVELYPDLVRVLQDMGDFAAAGLAIDAYARLIGDDVASIRLAASMQERLGRFDEAAMLHAQLVGRTRDAVDQIALLRAKMRAGEVIDVEAQLRTLSSTGGNAMVVRELAQFLARDGRLADARRLLDDAPEGVKIDAIRAEIEAIYGDLTIALRSARAAAKSERTVAADLFLANILLKMGETEEARTLLVATIEKSPDDPSSLPLAAMMLAGDTTEGGRKALRRALEAARSTRADLVAAVELLDASSAADGSILPDVQDLRLARDLTLQHSASPLSWRLASQLHAAAGEYDEAARIALMARSRLPNDESMAALAIDMCVQAGRFEDAAAGVGPWRRMVGADVLAADVASARVDLLQRSPSRALTTLMPHVREILAQPSSHEALAVLVSSAVLAGKSDSLASTLATISPTRRSMAIGSWLQAAQALDPKAAGAAIAQAALFRNAADPVESNADLSSCIASWTELCREGDAPSCAQATASLAILGEGGIPKTLLMADLTAARGETSEARQLYEALFLSMTGSAEVDLTALASAIRADDSRRLQYQSQSLALAALNNLAEMLLKHGLDAKEALALARCVDAVLPDSGEVTDTLVRALRVNGDFKEARARAEANPNQLLGALGLAEVELAEQRTSAASAAITQAELLMMRVTLPPRTLVQRIATLRSALRSANGDIEDGSDDPVGTTAPSSPEVK